jgi:hypothetical protein
MDDLVSLAAVNFPSSKFSKKSKSKSIGSVELQSARRFLKITARALVIHLACIIPPSFSASDAEKVCKQLVGHVVDSIDRWTRFRFTFSELWMASSNIESMEIFVSDRIGSRHVYT